MSQPGVLFDVDGTLLDTNYLHAVAWARAFRDVSPVEELPDMARIHRAIGLSSDALVEKLLGHPDDAAVEAHSRRYDELRGRVEPRRTRGASALLRLCSDEGLVVALATSGAEEDLEWMLPALGARDAVTGATTSSSVSSSKPSPDIFATAAEEHGVDLRSAAIVGDTVWDVEAATRLGVPAIGLTCGGLAAEELRVAGAEEVYEDPAALLAAYADDRTLLAGLGGGG
ncbi:MAG: HAD family hydrolase [Nocardioides sp.]|nr:HAD family hydrolase [Nocardioides sp.]